jgi:HTH-type transcriptional regulator, competence development regulator
MLFGEALRELRRKHGITQRDLANKTGLDFSYISKLENGRNPPPAADTIVKICKVLEEPPEQLLALTAKLPSDIQQTISGSHAAQLFLREAQRQNLTEEDWRLLSDQVKQLKGDD